MEKEKDQSNIGVSGGGGNSSSQQPKESEKQDKSLWWLVGFILALIIMAGVLAIL